MSSKHALYGDAKATASAGDGQRKQRALATAQEKYAADGSKTNRMAVATALFDLGKYGEAEEHMRALLEAHPGDPDVLFELGFAYKNQNRRDEAVGAWKQLVEANPKHALSHAAENEIWRLDPQYKPSWLRK